MPVPVSAKKILAVDDDPSIIEFLKTIIENWGYRYSSCENGMDAAVKIKQERPDLILLDVMLPDMDGITLCRRIRAASPQDPIPMIVITSLTDAATVQDAILFGAIDYVSKPFDQQILKSKIEKALQTTVK